MLEPAPPERDEVARGPELLPAEAGRVAPTAEAESAVDEDEVAAAEEALGAGPVAEAQPVEGGDPALEPDEEGEDRVASEVEATLAEEEPEPEGEEEEAEPEPIQRPRRMRAAIVVRNDPEAVLAGLVLARDRRHIVQFWVCSQDGLMDYFKTGATDLADNVDILLVGFTAEPVPQEVIQTAELYQGRLVWLDHHDWPVEDVELLRDAIGRESIVLAPDACSPLAAVTSIAERRSRFTDKVVDLAGRRLSEHDMEKWGYRMVGLAGALAAATGDQRSQIGPVLSGKPAELPDAEGVYEAERAWLEQHDPRLVYFGEYTMVVVRVPEHLDAGEVARRLRLSTGARLSLATREGDELAVLGCNEEKRHINAVGLIEQLADRIPWLHAKVGGDRVGRAVVEDLARHPERADVLVGEIVRNKSVLYG